MGNISRFLELELDLISTDDIDDELTYLVTPDLSLTSFMT